MGLSAMNVAKSGSDQQRAGSSAGEGGVHVAVCNRSRRGHHCKGWHLSKDWYEQFLNSDIQITKKRFYPLC